MFHKASLALALEFVGLRSLFHGFVRDRRGRWNRGNLESELRIC